MAQNYNKSFNFRNGVQVDDDNFIVNANGLVGIGTSVPRESLDVYGTVKITGLVTATNLAVTGISTFYSNVKVGSGITFYSSTGIVSATTFYGSAAGLTGFYAVAVDGWYVDSINSGIYTSFKVGIGTTFPQHSLQVGQNPSTGNGFSVDAVTGNVKTTGIITATRFSGPGDEVTSINASAITSGTLNGARLPQNISVSGIVTATSGFVGSLTGTATTASSLSGTPNITVANVDSTNINNTGIITSTSIRSGISSIGISTVYTRLYAESIGVGTNSPVSDIHIRRTSTSKLQLTSDSAEAIVALGRSTTLTGINGALRFGNTSGLHSYSTTNSLDIINYGLGNINQYLQLGSAGVGTGSYYWFNGQIPNTPLMTLTYGGSLGIGITLPTDNLHVVGTSTVTGNSYVGGNLSVANNLIAGGVLISNGTISNISVNGTFTGSFLGNVYSTTGISTFSQIKSTSTATFSGNVGIGTTTLTHPLQVNTNTNSFIVNSFGAIGVGTTAITSPGNNTVLVDSSQGLGIFQGVGIGTTNPRCYVDFADAGTSGPNVLAVGRFMLPPKVTTTQRNALATVEGGFIYNTTLRRLEVYNGTTWVGIATIA